MTATIAATVSGTGSAYGTGTASINDVLRLTGSTPFLSPLTAGNTKTLFLDFTKAGLGLGTDNSLNGQGCYNWRNAAMSGWTQSLFMSTTAVTADFGSGPVEGRAMQLLVAVPEPSTSWMALAGLACGGFSMWRRRKRA